MRVVVTHFVHVILWFLYTDHIHQILSKADDSPLAQYVYASDPLYSWQDVHHTFIGATNHGLYTAHVINMTSGSFLNESIINHVIWWHYIVIIIPNPKSGPPASTQKAFFWTQCADPGSNTNTDILPNETDLDVLIAAEVATQSNLIGFVIYTNPNNPIVWSNDPSQKQRSNDSLLAYSLRESMFYGYPPLFFPMVRANVRALDALQAYTREKFQWDLKQFAVSGASKWGWLTWLFAAVDDRVTAFVPVVFDMLNWERNAHHQYQSYGGWTWAIKDYWEEGLPAYLDSDMENHLFTLVDPFVFRESYAGKPKLVVHNTRDEFFMPDDTWFWWQNMTEPKWSLLVPNTEHSSVTGLMEIIPAVSTWVYTVLMMDYHKIIPQLTWVLDHETYTISAETDELPVSAKIWVAESCRKCNGRRDFRALNLDDPCPSETVIDGKCYNENSIWVDEDIQFVHRKNGKYLWSHTIYGPAEFGGAYRAFFMDFKFNVTKKIGGKLGWPFDNFGVIELSTECMVANNSYPFADCSGFDCNATLV